MIIINRNNQILDPIFAYRDIDLVIKLAFSVYSEQIFIIIIISSNNDNDVLKTEQTK